MTWGFVFLGALCPIPAGILWLGLAPASSTNPSATSLREPSVPTLHPPCSRRVLKARFGLSSTAKSSPNRKNTPWSSACLPSALSSSIVGKRNDANKPSQLRSQRALAWPTVCRLTSWRLERALQKRPIAIHRLVAGELWPPSAGMPAKPKAAGEFVVYDLRLVIGGWRTTVFGQLWSIAKCSVSVAKQNRFFFSVSVSSGAGVFRD